VNPLSGSSGSSGHCSHTLKFTLTGCVIFTLYSRKGNIQGTSFMAHPSGNIQGTYRAPVGHIQGTFRHSGNIQRTFREQGTGYSRKGSLTTLLSNRGNIPFEPCYRPARIIFSVFRAPTSKYAIPQNMRYSYLRGNGERQGDAMQLERKLLSRFSVGGLSVVWDSLSFVVYGLRRVVCLGIRFT
jgi:hypothetical protein